MPAAGGWSDRTGTARGPSARARARRAQLASGRLRLRAGVGGPPRRRRAASTSRRSRSRSRSGSPSGTSRSRAARSGLSASSSSARSAPRVPARRRRDPGAPVDHDRVSVRPGVGHRVLAAARRRRPLRPRRCAAGRGRVRAAPRALREQYLPERFPPYIFDGLRSRYRTGMAFVVAIVAGGFARSLRRETRRANERADEAERLARREADARERLEELDVMKTDFIAITSHELRTPLVVDPWLRRHAPPPPTFAPGRAGRRVPRDRPAPGRTARSARRGPADRVQARSRRADVVAADDGRRHPAARGRARSRRRREAGSTGTPSPTCGRSWSTPSGSPRS